MELPEVPRSYEVIEGLWDEVFGPYDADEMRAYGIACAQAALEAAAKVCDGRAEWIDCDCGCEMQKPKGPRDNAFVQAAASIRAIQVQP